LDKNKTTIPHMCKAQLELLVYTLLCKS